MTTFSEKFGQKLSINDVSTLTGVTKCIIRAYPERYGGMRHTAPGKKTKLVFFEKLLIKAMEESYANQTNTQQQNNMEGANYPAERQTEGENMPDQKRGAGMGNLYAQQDNIYLESRNNLW